jgi:hypothetical protein
MNNKVGEYWERRACGSNRAEAPTFTPEYFQQIEQFRYEHEPFIPDFAKFNQSRGQQVLEVGVGANRSGVAAYAAAVADRGARAALSW